MLDADVHRTSLTEKLVRTRWLVAAVIMNAATATWAELPVPVPPPESVKITPAPNDQASTPPSTQAAPDKEKAGYSRKETAQNNAFSGSPKDFGSVANGCARITPSLCYDYRTGRTVYLVSRKLLPEISGLTPKKLALHPDKVVVQYTFK